ncbi:MAG: apolipoprotein N-acyltransferase [Clostridia bacterium]|nr:apolipoprotein N-acyltransferase [Clostridia bacterium]
MDKLRKTIDRSALKNPICLVICFLSGAVGALPYYFEAAFPLTFISLIAFFCVLICRLRAKRKIFFPCFFYFLGFYIPVYFFLSELYPFARFGFSGSQAVFVLICACVLIPAYHALLRSLVLLLLKAIPKRLRTCLTFSFVFLLSELITTVGTLAFPWANVAVSLTGFLPYLQIASLFGVTFITLITAAVCFAAAKFFTGSENIKRYLLIALAVFTVNTAAGAVIYFIPVGAKETVSAALVQGNISSNDKWAAENREAIFEKYVSLASEAAKNDAKLIVLPESAIPMDFVPEGRLHKAFSKICKEYGAVIIAGVTVSENKVSYNSVLAVLPDGSVTERYDKRHPVPFGEFIPFADVIGKFFPFVKEFNESSSDYGAGDSFVNLDTGKGVYGPVVCFDSIFPQFTREAAKNGAQALVVVTNDSWFEDSAGIYTHLRHAQLRAIENRKPVLRAANTGISAFIKNNGTVRSRSEALTEEIVYGTVFTNDSVSLYSRIGDTGVFILYAAILLLHIIFIIFKRYDHGKNKTARKRDL